MTGSGSFPNLGSIVVVGGWVYLCFIIDLDFDLDLPS